MFKKLFCIILSLSIAFAASGCRKEEAPPAESEDDNVLTIAVYEGKYGKKWIEAIVDAYKSQNPLVTINLKTDPRLDQKAGNILESRDDTTDILFLPNTNWQYWASKNYIADLSPLFKEKVDNNMTFEGKILPDYLPHCKYNGKYYAVPWDDGVAGFVYNKKMFEENGWEVPATTRELFELLPKIKQAGIVPIAWAGKSIADWSYAVNNWWAQFEGIDGMKEYLKMKSPEVYLQQGRINALELFELLVSDPANSMNDVVTADSEKAIKLFFSSKAAMLLGGSWIECEAGDIPADFSMEMMRVPAVEGAKNPNVNVDAAGGFAVVSSQSKHIGLAEDFLKFMATDEMLELYTKITSSPRPFVYDAASVDGLSDFGKSVMQIWQSSDNLYLFSDNPAYYNVFSDWPNEGAPYMRIFLGLQTPQEAVEENYKYVKEHWDSAVKSSSQK